MSEHPVELSVEDPTSADAAWCVGQYVAEIDALFAGGYDIAKAVAVGAEDLRAPRGAFVVARIDGAPVGCGGVKLTPGEPAFLKRMWVSPAARGHGVGAAMLSRLEQIARESGASAVRLDTHSSLEAAARLYESKGYVQVLDFNGEVHANRWYAKDL